MKSSLLFILSVFLTAGVVSAVPGIFNHQGRIAVDGVNVDGVAFFKFAFVNSDGTETYWTNDGSASGEPAQSVGILVTKGHYAILLGETNAISPAIFGANEDVRLRIWFSSDDVTFRQLAPDRRITPTAYAFAASALTASYDVGAGGGMEFQSATGSMLTLESQFTEKFSAPPTITLENGWTLESVDENGFQAKASLTTTIVDAGGNVGNFSSLAVIGGNPAIAYWDSVQEDLYFVRSSDSSGLNWPASNIVRVDGLPGDVGWYCSLAEVDGRPAIAYYDSTNGDLCFIRANDANGISWPNNPVVVDGTFTNVGHEASLAVIGGVPAIAFESPNTGEVHYAWADDSLGTTWNTTAIEGSIASRRLQPSLTEVSGKPAMAFYNSNDKDLRYAFLSGSDPSSSGDWTILDVDTAGEVGRNPSLTVVNGRPAVAYDDLTGEIKFVRASDAIGSSWPGIKTIGNGQSASLAQLNGSPAVSSYDPVNGELKLSIAVDQDGGFWPLANQVIVDGATSDVGSYHSLAGVEGLPGIAYYDATSFDLKFATLPDARWSARLGDAEPILASGVKEGGVTSEMLADDLGIWSTSGPDLFYEGGRVGVGRLASKNALEVEGTASKTTAGSWLANSDRRIKEDVREITGALEKLNAVRLVDFEYTREYRAAHPSIEDRRYPNVIAQEFAKVFPDWVQSSEEKIPGEQDKILQVDTYPINIYTAAAVQELAKENAELKKRLDRLEKLLEARE